MTIKEIAETLGKDESTIRKIGKQLFPESFQNGIKTELTEMQTTAIKLNLGNNSELPKTTLEKQLLIRQAMFLQDEMINELRAQIADAQPKIEFFDSVTSSKDAIDMKDAAKVLNIGIGRNTLFQKLRDLGILMENKTPYQTYIDRGYFRVIESRWVTPQGETKISLKTVVYQRGLDYILKAVK